MVRKFYWEKPFKKKVFCKAEDLCPEKKCSHKLTAWEKNTLSKMHPDQLIVYDGFPDCEVWKKITAGATDQLKRLSFAQVLFNKELENDRSQ